MKEHKTQLQQILNNDSNFLTLHILGHWDRDKIDDREIPRTAYVFAGRHLRKVANVEVSGDSPLE
jgi:hypothetical protein